MTDRMSKIDFIGLGEVYRGKYAIIVNSYLIYFGSNALNCKALEYYPQIIRKLISQKIV